MQWTCGRGATARVLRRTLSCSFLLIWTAPALGHTLLISRGEVALTASEVAVRIDVNGEGFLHWYGLTVDDQGLIAAAHIAAAARRHERVLDDGFIIRDAAGHRLPSGGFRAEADWPEDASASRFDPRLRQVRYRAKFAVAGAPAVLAFQLLPESAGASMPWQIVLRIRGASEEVATLPLTSRGNVEIVPLGRFREPPVARTGSPQAPLRCRRDQRLEHRGQEIFADVEATDTHIDAQLRIPLPLLSTFHEVRRDDPDFLSTQEQASVVQASRNLLTEALSITVDGERLKAELTRLELLNTFETLATGASDSQPVSYWLGSLQARIRFSADTPIAHATVEWNLFNNAIPTGSACFRAAGECIEHEFSTYAPRYEWARP